jgi:glutaminyl-peptide cyclotransferase
MSGARSIIIAIIIFAASQLAWAGGLADFARANDVPIYEVEITGGIPHSAQSFTQGLLLHDGALYESTGLYGKSALNKLDPATGELLQSAALDSVYFGEGLAFCSGELVQLTWQEHTALVWKLPDFDLAKTYSYSGEGWGLTSNGLALIMSNGSAWLYRRSVSDFALEDSVAVTIAGRRVTGLNELEYANGRIYANFLGVDDIAEIDPASGRITAVVDAAALRDLVTGSSTETPLNGIAYDSASGEFLLTGKLWPKIFRVKFITSFGR